HGSRDDGHIELSFLVTGSYAVVRVADDGRPGVPVPAGEPVAPPLHSVRGRGRLIMHALAQRVTTAPMGDGTEVVLEFDRIPTDGPGAIRAARRISARAPRVTPPSRGAPRSSPAPRPMSRPGRRRRPPPRRGAGCRVRSPEG